jgi:peptide/nickel transport system substrate-binding protein
LTRRDKFIVVGLIGLLAVTSAVAVVLDRLAPPPEPDFGGTYVEGVAGAPRFLNPLLAASAVDEDVSALVFAGLMRHDRRGQVVPDLAETFRIGEEGKVWDFELRPDAVWHDGAPVVPEDVLYTVRLAQDPAYAGPFAEAFRGVTVEKTGPASVRFTLQDVYAPFAASTTMGLLPAHELEGVGYAELPQHGFNARPIGSGAFKVSELDARRLVLARHEPFYRTNPERTRAYLDRLVLRFYPTATDALGALARREVDGVGGLGTVDADRARALPEVELLNLPTNDFTALFLNVRPEKVVFRERAVRQAIASAVDRSRLMRAAVDERGSLADTFVPSGSWALPADLKRSSYSVEDARSLLEQADWKDRDGDGFREKQGRTLAFTITTSDEPARVVAAAHVAQDLAAVGMRVEVRTVSFDDLVGPVSRQRAFDAMLVGINMGIEPDPYPFFHSTQIRDPGFNFSGYTTLALDRSLEAARRTVDVEKRKEHYAQVFQAIAQEVPIVFLYFADYVYARNRSVQGLEISPISEPAERLFGAEDWYVRTTRRR